MRRDLATALSLVSVVACAVIMSSAYFRYHGQYQTPPPVLNGDFRYWTRDASSNQWKPYLWEVDTFKGPNDTLSVFQKKIEGRDCLALRVFQDGSNDTYDWASLHVRQEMRGQALKTLFISNIGLWVYPTFSYDSEVERYNPLNAFGVEVNDGTNLLWFVFSDANVGVYELVRHRIVVIPTPLGELSLIHISEPTRPY